MKVKSTKNYNKFKTVRGNRELNRSYLKKLTESVASNNMLEANPIIVTKDFYVIDGQHRLAVAEKLGLPIFYIVVASGNIDEIQQLNVNQRGWMVRDFYESWVSRGKKEYLELKDFIEKHDLSIAVGRRLLDGTDSTGGSNAKKVHEFKKGNFKVTHKKEAEKFIERIKEISDIIDKDLLKDRTSMRAFQKAYESGMPHDEFVSQLKKRGKFTQHHLIRDAVREIEDVLSYNKKKVVRIPYATMSLPN